MRIYNKYVVSLVLAASLINTSLAFFGQNELALYFTINIITFLVITLLYVYFTPRARRVLNTIGVVLFAGFIVIVVLKAMEFLSGG